MDLGRADKITKVNGEKVKLYYVGKLADAINRTSQTIRLWENKDIIPKAIFKSKDRRLYSKEQIETIVKVVEETGIRPGKSLVEVDFPRKVHNAINELNKKYVGDD